MAAKTLDELLRGTTRFGTLTVLGEAERKTFKCGTTSRQADCLCDCGTRRSITVDALLNGAKSCGCSRAPRIRVGDTFGRWTVIGDAVSRQKPSGVPVRIRFCRCACGNERPVFEASLRNGASKSCGCLKAEASASRRYRHGHGKKGEETPEFTVWMAIQQRCSNPNNSAYRYYGGKGIRVADEWVADFRRFLEDVGPRPTPSYSLDRIRVDGNYEPGNCRWATKSEQMRNRTCNRIVHFRGRDITLAEAVEIAGVDYGLAHRRIVYDGWEVERALLTPARRCVKRVVQRKKRAPKFPLLASPGAKNRAPGSHSNADIRRIFSLQKGRCAYCRDRLGRGFQRDHIVPICAGGTNDARNIQLTCPACNATKGPMLPDQFARALGRLV